MNTKQNSDKSEKALRIGSVVVSISNDELHKQIHSSFEWAVSTGNLHYGDETDERLFDMYFEKAFNRMLEVENYSELTDDELTKLSDKCVDVF